MTHPLALIGAAQAALDIDCRYEHGHYVPTIDVKNRAWLPRDIPWDALRDEHGDQVDVVREWITALDDRSEYDQLSLAEDIARESWWDDAQEEAEELLTGGAKVYSSGRSGGHLIVEGIGEPEAWTSEECQHTLAGDYCYDDKCEGFDCPDLERVYAWYTFVSAIEAMKADFPYQVGWHLIVNVHEPIHDLQGVI